MRIEILSGNQMGQVIDLPQTEAEVAIATGYGRAAPAPVVVHVRPKKATSEAMGVKPKQEDCG